MSIVTPTVRNERIVRAPRGNQLTTKSWQTEAPLRLLMNNLDSEVAERPQELVVYGGIGRAARNWESIRSDRRRAQGIDRRADPAGAIG